ncbi:MAG: hypothetical protein U0793_32970 [Gemmataceae bacterium]
MEVSWPQLVPVPADSEDADAVAFQRPEPVLDRRRDRDPLAGDGVAVLQSGGADVPRPDAEPLRDLTLKVGRAEPAFLDPEIQELP